MPPKVILAVYNILSLNPITSSSFDRMLKKAASNRKAEVKVEEEQRLNLVFNLNLSLSLHLISYFKPPY